MPSPFGPLRVLTLSGTPYERGLAHGRAHASEIRAYALDRSRLVVAGTTVTPEEALDLVEMSIPAHAAYAPDLLEETAGLAEGAAITVAQALLVSGYTDFLDVVRAHAGNAGHEDDCTALLLPPALAEGGGLLAQTWDMHASATPHVVLLRVMDRLPSLVFTTLGCIGQIGMNEAGIAIGINNLSCTDGGPGVAWPFVVRKALQQDDLEAALGCIVDAPLAGAHNFLLMGKDGSGYNVEAMPTERVVTSLGERPLLHTNHCVAPTTQLVEAARDPELANSSTQRLAEASDLLAGGVVTVEDVMKLTADERSICRKPDPVYHYETCGAAVMRPSTGDFWACWGRPSESEYEHHRVGA
jgi:isopenicillin-N N-acyltransferase-like protein